MTLAGEIPVFINCRDRLTPLLELLDYLERAGCERVHLLDNDSTYPPLLELYERTPHDVIRLGRNLGHKALWESGVLDALGVRGAFVLSDPDTVPIEDCPLDALDFFAGVLERYPDSAKVGFGLKIDDLPDRFRHKAEVIAWESKFWLVELEPRLYRAPIDTTFALYRSGAEHAPREAIRTGHPYLARHTTWYLDSEDLPEEERYYRGRAREQIVTWAGDAIPHRLAWRLARDAPPGPEARPENSSSTSGES